MKKDMSDFSLDDQFMILLHKKIMDKTGSAKRRAKKYYMDKYKKTGIIPEPLRLAGKGVMDGRKCSGRPRALTQDVKNRFIEIVRASCDADDPRFIYITRKARVITNYKVFLEEEFQKTISIHALRRLVRNEDLDLYLKQPDFDETQMEKGYFNPVPVFDLVQMDGCNFQYIKIKDDNGKWCKPQVIEFYDTGSRYMFVLEFYFSETSLNAVDLFIRFLLEAPLPKKRIRLRPDIPCRTDFIWNLILPACGRPNTRFIWNPVIAVSIILRFASSKSLKTELSGPNPALLLKERRKSQLPLPFWILPLKSSD
jgi:hypothetical protein